MTPVSIPTLQARAKAPHILSLLLGCTALCASPALAQNNSADPLLLSPILIQADNDTEDLVATGTSAGIGLPADLLDTSASVSVVTAKEVKTRGATTIEQVLNYTAGVVTDYWGADNRYDYFNIRGFDAYTYRDGLRIGDPFGGIREVPFGFERIEVVKGGNSTTFGVTDPGGIVNFVSKTPKAGKYGETYLTLGNNSKKEVGFDFGDTLKSNDTLSYRFVGLLRDADAEWDHSRDDEKYLSASIAWRPSDATSLTFVLDHLKRNGVPGGGGHPVGTDLDSATYLGEPDFNYLDVTRTTASLIFDHAFDNGLQLGVSARYTDFESDFGYVYVDDRTNVTTGSTVVNRSLFADDSEGRDFVINAKLGYNTSFGQIDSRTVVGVEYADYREDDIGWFTGVDPIDYTNISYTGGYTLDTISPFRSRSREDTTKSLYLQQELIFDDRFIANFGLRHDKGETTRTNRFTDSSTSSDYSENTARLGLTYKITPDLSVFGNYAESVVPAGVSVEPERGRQYELGVKYRPNGGRALLTAAVYDLTQFNMTVTNPNTLLDETIGEANVKGIDLEAKVDLYKNISLVASYAHIDSEVVEDGTGGNEGNELRFTPKNTAALWVDYTLPATSTRGNMNFGLGLRYSGESWADRSNSARIDSFTVVDAAFSYDIREDTNLRVNVTNLLDEKHYTPTSSAVWNSPGRAITATLTRRW